MLSRERFRGNSSIDWQCRSDSFRCEQHFSHCFSIRKIRFPKETSVEKVRNSNLCGSGRSTTARILHALFLTLVNAGISLPHGTTNKPDTSRHVQATKYFQMRRELTASIVHTHHTLKYSYRELHRLLDPNLSLYKVTMEVTLSSFGVQILQQAGGLWSVMRLGELQEKLADRKAVNGGEQTVAS